MLETLLTRRSEMLRLKSSGVSLGTIINDLSEKYDVSKRALYFDWNKRKNWIKALLSLEDSETFFLDILATHKQIYNLGVIEHLKGDNSSARIGALNLMKNVNKDLYEMVALHDLIIRVDRLEGEVSSK